MNNGIKMGASEETHLYNLSLIPAGVLLIVFLVLFVYLMQTDALGTIWDVFGFIVPFWLVIIETIFLSFEMLYKRTFNKSFNWKRLIGRTTLTTLGFALAIAVLSFFSFQFPWMSESSILLLVSITWFVIWIILFFGLKEIFKKLSEGQW
jgi:hypothetical protein